MACRLGISDANKGGICKQASGSVPRIELKSKDLVEERMGEIAVMHPSKRFKIFNDHLQDDPVYRKCISFSKTAGSITAGVICGVFGGNTAYTLVAAITLPAYLSWMMRIAALSVKNKQLMQSLKGRISVEL